MAYNLNLPRFVKVDYATYSAGTPADNTLYFITDLGVIYQGNNLVTKSVQTDNTKKVPGLFYVLGSGKDAQIVTYASADAEPTIIAVSENAIDAKVKVASDAAAAAQEAADAVAKDLEDNYSTTTEVEGLISAAKEEINGTIDKLTTADITFSENYEAATGGLIDGSETLEAAIKEIDARVATLAGTGEGGDDLSTISAKVAGLQDVVDGYTAKGSIKTAVDAAQGDATQALADAKQANDAIAAMDSELDATGTAAKGGVFVVSGVTQVDGVITAVDSVEVEQAGAAAAVEAKLANYTTTEDMNAILGGSYSKEATVKAAIDAAASAGTDAAAAVDAKLGGFSAEATAKMAVDAINAKIGGSFDAENTVDAAIKAVDAKFASYSTTEQVDGKINAALSSVLKFKGVVADRTALDAITGMVEGDVYYVTAESKEFVYVDEDGKKGWEELGATVDYAGMLAPYLLIGDTFADGEILVASVDGDAKSAKTTGIKVGGAAFEDTPAATTLATEKAVADLLAQMEWKTTM